MAALIFLRSSNRIGLARRDRKAKSGWSFVGRWNAHNEVASTAKGPWPLGVYRWSHYNAHAETGVAPACLATSYGCSGIHVFDVRAHGRAGMGIHAGRINKQTVVSGVGGKTMGCIRVSEEAMNKINDVHEVDRLQFVLVLDHEDDLRRAEEEGRSVRYDRNKA